MRMRLRRVVVSFLLLSLLGGGMIFADTVVNKIKLTVNGTELNDSAIVVDGTTYVPLRQVANLFGAFVMWDNKQVSVNKPNIHMMAVKDDTYFQGVRKGSTLTFNVLVQGDSVVTPISEIKLVIADPYGSEKEIYYETLTENVKIFKLDPYVKVTYEFKHSGDYKLRMYMKPEKSNDWIVVSEKIIVSK